VTPSTKSILSLIQVLAVSTFFCGLLTGTFFGANIYDLDWPIVQRLKHAVLMDNNDMFQLSLILGAVQYFVRHGAESGKSDDSVWLQICSGEQ